MGEAERSQGSYVEVRKSAPRGTARDGRAAPPLVPTNRSRVSELMLGDDGSDGRCDVHHAREPAAAPPKKWMHPTPLLAIALSLAALTGCSVNVTAVASTSTPTVDTSRNYTAPASPEPAAAPNTRPATLPGPTTPGMQPAPQNVGAATGGYLGDLPVHLAIDLGPIPHANGTVITDQAGTPVRYIVGSDDNTVAVSDRFSISQYLLAALNCVRRADDQLYVGDTLNLDAETIVTVGDEDGSIYDFVDRLALPHPPQR